MTLSSFLVQVFLSARFEKLSLHLRQMSMLR